MAWSHFSPMWANYEIMGLSELITWSVGSPIAYTVSVSPSQSVFTAVASPAGISVQSIKENLRGLYPVESLTYLDPDYVEHVVTEWDHVPAGCRVIDMIPHRSRTFTFTLTCVCNYLTPTTPPVPAVASVVLDLVIWQHYDVHKQLYNDLIEVEIRE